MNNIITPTRFAGFDYEANNLSAYIFSIDLFIISLKDSEELVRFQPDNPDAFLQWLEGHGVRNVNATLGKMVHGHYFKGG